MLREKFSLLTPHEKIMLELLSEAMPKFYVFPQVSLIQIFYRPNPKAFDELIGMSVDFCVCRKDDLSIVMAIEINEKSHDCPERQKADRVKANALKEAGVPLVTFRIDKDDDVPTDAQVKEALAPFVVRRMKRETERNEVLRKVFPGWNKIPSR